MCFYTSFFIFSVAYLLLAKNWIAILFVIAIKERRRSEILNYSIMKSFKSIFPFDQSVIAEYKIMDNTAIDKALITSEKCLLHWSAKTFSERAEILKNVSVLLMERKESLAKLITQEMGKVVKESIAEIEKCALGCDYFADNAAQFLQDEIIKTNYENSFVVFQSIGAVFAIMPWNFLSGRYSVLLCLH
jgi:succinate-semialdehyde dehydrogenase/glutarate-semialdehyde dehydrogenase